MGTPVSNSVKNFLWNSFSQLMCLHNDIFTLNGLEYPQERLVAVAIPMVGERAAAINQCVASSGNYINSYHVVGNSRKRRWARRIRRARRKCKQQMNKLSFFKVKEVQGNTHLYCRYLKMDFFLVYHCTMSIIFRDFFPWYWLRFTTVFVDMRLWKTKQSRKRFQNFRQLYVLSTYPIEIHQSQPASMT